jgi:hypothetical protein
VGADFWREFGLVALGALATLVSSWLLIRAGRRDRREDKFTSLEDEVEDHGDRLTGIEVHLGDQTGYVPPQRRK